MIYEHYFNTLGYKVLTPSYFHLIIKDFQRRTGLKDDGVIGNKTRAKISQYNKLNYCPEVFEHIKPYKQYNDTEIEALMQGKLKGLGATFNRYARENDFDVLHSIAHSVIESGWGESLISMRKNNIYGWCAYDSSPLESAKGFKSKAECIEKWSKWFNDEYLEQTGKWFSGDNEYCVNINYATSPIAAISKSFVVKQLRGRLNGF